MNELIKHLNALGYFPKDFAPDGKIHRFDKDGKNDGWILAFRNITNSGDEYFVATFGSWKTGESETYQTAMKFTKHDKQKIEADIEAAKKKLEAERIERQHKASAEAETIWAGCSDNPNSDYLKRKKIGGLYGCKTAMGNEGREIFVPMRDAENKLWGIQRIMSSGAKYFMEGQRKESTFHVIPFAESLEEVDCIRIAEGFATAATIYEATNYPVVVAFDSGNLLSVAKALKAKFPDKAVIICGDDDRFSTKPDGSLYNAGRDCAEKSAKAVLGKCVFPKFKVDNLKPTDFNDLYLAEGINEVKNQILGVKPEFHAVHCLGYQDDTYYFISSDKPTVTSISRGSFSKLSLLDLMPLPYWETNFPTKQGANWDGAIDYLMRGCRTKGVFIPKMVRGAGVWKDAGKTVVNLGDSLWIDGELKQYREFKSRYIYQSATKVMFPKEDFATTEELSKLAEAFEMLSWKKKSSPKLLMGFVMIAPICGSLQWRPHIWLTGSSGTGKSFIMNSVMSNIFGDNAAKMIGESTGAGVRQHMKSDAKPVWFDELETDDERSSERVKGVIELCRIASSETDAEVVKGTAHGKSISFSVRYSAIVSSIRPNLQHEQDKNRFALLELTRNERDNFTGENGIQCVFERILTESFIEKLYARSVHKVDLILENKKTFFKVMLTKYNGRFADQYGTLLAGYYAAMQDEAVTEDEAKFAIEKFINLEEEADTIKQRDEGDCLKHLMLSTVKYGNENVTIARLIARHRAPAVALMPGAEPYQEALMTIGIKVIDKQFIAVQFSNPELKRIFKGEKWAAGWSNALKRIPEATVTNVRFDGQQNKCVKIPYTEDPEIGG